MMMLHIPELSISFDFDKFKYMSHDYNNKIVILKMEDTELHLSSSTIDDVELFKMLTAYINSAGDIALGRAPDESKNEQVQEELFPPEKMAELSELIKFMEKMTTTDGKEPIERFKQSTSKISTELEKIVADAPELINQAKNKVVNIMKYLKK